MELNSTPSSERIHIAFFGKCNVGKSSLVNAITGQTLSIVSDIKGTTTDPVYKSMELLPLGPVMIIDTPGLDDNGELGTHRINKTKQVLNKTDIAILVKDINEPLSILDDELIKEFENKNINYIIVYNKSDLHTNLSVYKSTLNQSNLNKSNLNDSNLIGHNLNKSNLKSLHICVSVKDNYNIDKLKELIASFDKDFNKDYNSKQLVGDLINPKDLIILVTPIDESAPKGRLILPQQQVIRNILDNHAIPIVVQENELQDIFNSLKDTPKLVITDSQAFKNVNNIVPSNIYLTSFSILLARYKGFLDTAVQGVRTLDILDNNDYVLISEGCTHHRQCKDIGTVKLPTMIKNYTNKNINFDFTSGGEFKENLDKYKLIVHCGGCMLNTKEMLYRQDTALAQNVPFTNYGILIAYINGILNRSIEILKQ